MSKNSNDISQTSLFLRILGGVYLVYLAWDMRSAIPEGPLFIIPIIFFAVVGAALAGHSIWYLIRSGYFLKPSADETETTEDREDASNE